MIVRAERVVVVGVRVVALGEEALLRLVRAGGGGVETELVAVLALLLELVVVAADDDDDVWVGRTKSVTVHDGREHVRQGRVARETDRSP